MGNLEGTSEPVDYLLLNHIITIGEQVIFQCRNRAIKPALSLLTGKLKSVGMLHSKGKRFFRNSPEKWEKTFISLIEYIICNVVIFFRYYCKIYSKLCRFSFFIPCLSINFLSFFVLSVHVLSASVSINVIKTRVPRRRVSQHPCTKSQNPGPSLVKKPGYPGS